MKTIEQKAKAYDEALKVLHKYDGANIMFSQSLKEEMFPELAESEDEKIREKLIGYFSSVKGFSSLEYNYGITGEDAVAWLEKQGETSTEDFGEFINILSKQFPEVSFAKLSRIAVRVKKWLEKQSAERKQLYVRFGDIPSNEKSKIYRGEEEIGEENGVSVYPAFELNGNIVLGLTLPITRTTLYTQQHLLEYDNRPCYLVSGDYVGSGTDGEPLIRNISIIKRLDNYRIKEIEKQGEQKPTCILDNSESNVKFPFKAKVKSNGKIVTIQGGQLSMDCEEYVKYVSNAEDGYKVYEPEDLELVCNIEQKFNDKVEPKFHEGDWIVSKTSNLVYRVDSILYPQSKCYYLSHNGGIVLVSFTDEQNYRPWTIEDAKDGDILADEYGIYIFNSFDSLDDKLFICKCAYEYSKKVLEIGGMLCSKTDVYPASKKQRDLLFQKIKEAGYEWDADKKELKKIDKENLTEFEIAVKNVMEEAIEAGDTHNLRERYTC